MRILPFLLLFAVIGSGSGCTKPEETTYHGKMWNGEAEALTVDIYRTMDDYNNAANMLKRVVVPASGEAEIPKELESGVTYYADVYSEGYSLTNWGIDPSLPVANTTPDMGIAVRLLVRSTSVRKMLLKDNLTSTTWSAFAVDGIGDDTWDSLPEYHRYRKFVFRRDLTGAYIYRTSMGQEEEMPFRILHVLGVSHFTILFTGSDASGIAFTLSPYIDFEGNVRLDTMSTSTTFPPSGQNQYRYFFARD